MQLGELLGESGVDARLDGGEAAEIARLDYDSRAVAGGSLFFCFPGEKIDGHDFAQAAIDAGAAALVVERPLGLGVPEAEVDDARAAMAPVAARFFGDPTARLEVAGITGTNGKTTTAFLLRQLLEADGRQTGLLGTVQQVVGGKVSEVVRTTPEAIDLQATFAAMLEAGDVACAMEVSSHALVLHRADAIRFAVRAFTNLTQDHLDFHADMDDYFAAKKMLFGFEGGPSVVNIDDPYGARLAAELAGAGGELITFSASGDDRAHLAAVGPEFDATGARFRLRAPEGEHAVTTPLPGDFNVENALAALACAHALGVDLGRAAEALAAVEQVPGRFEPIDEGQPFGVLVDYAHTPDSLENVLGAARRLTEGRLISVFGAGGDRDREKRPLMGRAGAEGSDITVVTSDNPRSEDPDAIIEEILGGIPDRESVVVEPDRRTAIAHALDSASKGDTVVIAGKGHEQGQEFEGGRKIPFDDRDVARDELRKLSAGAAK